MGSIRPTGAAQLTSGDLPALASLPPKEFGGPGDQWSPEGLFAASIVDCFMLNFQVIAGVSKFA
jgi:organic hydroperoxide reductase OsmC/OhrA